MRAPVGVAAALLVSACRPVPYTPGDLAEAARVEPLGCVDVGMTVSSDAAAWDFLTLELGNRCPRPVPFDLTSMRILATGPDGITKPTRLRDPRFEIVPLTLDASTYAKERFRIERVDGDGQRVAYCFTLDGVVPAAGAAPAAPAAGVAGRAVEACFDRRGAGWVPRGSP